jgi:hypothetical protein
MLKQRLLPLINYHYASLFLLLLSLEMGIALWVNDTFIRPYVGDMLVVILLYTLIKSLFPLSTCNTAISIFFFACCVEVAQYFRLIEALALEHNSLARILIGTQFDWKDLLAYGLGTVVILTIEYSKRRENA